MALPVFPTATPDDKQVIQGSPELYLASYVTAGGDPSATTAVAYLGNLDEDGCDIEGGPTFKDIQGSQGFGPSDRRLTGEAMKIKTTLQQAPIALWALLKAGSLMTVTSSALTTTDNLATVSTTKVVGGGGLVGSTGVTTGTAIATNKAAPFYQLIMRLPSETISTTYNLYATLQIFKGSIMPTGAQKRSRDNKGTFPIEITAYWDWSITPGVTYAASVPSAVTGCMWKYIAAQS